MLAYLPATYLAAPDRLPHRARVGVLGVPRPRSRSAIALLASAIGRRPPPRRRSSSAWASCSASSSIDMLIGAPLQLNAVFGYSPTVGGRFAGMGNLAYGQFAGAAFLLFGLVLQRLAGWRFATAAALSMLVVADRHRRHADVGLRRRWGAGLRPRGGGHPGAAARTSGVSVRSLIALGIARGDGGRRRSRWWTSAGRPTSAPTWDASSSRSATRVGGAESVIVRKLDANFSVIGSSVWTAMVPVALGFIVYLLWRAPGHVQAIRDTIRESLRASPWSGSSASRSTTRASRCPA